MLSVGRTRFWIMSCLGRGPVTSRLSSIQLEVGGFSLAPFSSGGFTEWLHRVASPSGFTDRLHRVASPSGFTEWLQRVASPSGFTEWLHRGASPSGFTRPRQPVACADFTREGRNRIGEVQREETGSGRYRGKRAERNAFVG